MRTDAASNYLLNDFLKILHACGYKWGWLSISKCFGQLQVDWINLSCKTMF